MTEQVSTGTVTDTEAPETGMSTARAAPTLGTHVASKIGVLQKRMLSGDDSGARALLARLRRAVGQPIGAEPAVWEVVFDRLPARYIGSGDEPSAGEQAAYAATTLYAVHQQSKASPMHVPRTGFGTAIRRLVSPADVEQLGGPIMRRFNALTTADGLSEVLHHARGLVQLLRREDVGFDYGAFADDLYWLQDPRHANKVRLRWARQFHRTINTPTTTQETTES